MMHRCREWCLVALMLLAARAVGAQALAGPPLNAQARAHFEKALTEYSAANYRAASVEFELAYGLSSRPELLFGWAQSERLSGNCDRAVMLYRRFLDQAPSEAEAAKAVRQIERCRAANTTESTSPDTTPPGDDIAINRPPPQPQSTTLSPRAERITVDGHWYSDPWVDSAVVGGAAAAVVGGVFLWLAHSDDNAASGATVYGDARHFTDEAGSRRAFGGITLASGSALVLGGIGLSWWRRDRGATFAAQISAGTVGIAGAF